jgi:hypothetical protein
MSRLESFIRRLEAQRSCIDFAARPGHLPQGPIFELGLGNGRTFDHLRAVFPSREIFVFDRRVDAHPQCVPDPRHLILGEIAETLPRVAPFFRGRVALVHLDISSGDPALDRATVAMLAPLLDDVAAPGALVASDQPLPIGEWQRLSLFEVPKDRYFVYRNAEDRREVRVPADGGLRNPNRASGRASVAATNARNAVGPAPAAIEAS